MCLVILPNENGTAEVKVAAKILVAYYVKGIYQH